MLVRLISVGGQACLRLFNWGRSMAFPTGRSRLNIENYGMLLTIKTAILSRELEKDRDVIDQRFDRAERLAVKYGSNFQQSVVTHIA